MSTGSDVIVRRSARHDLALPARVRVAPGFADRVSLSVSQGDRGGWVEGDLVDFGEGGIGIVSRVFFPKACRLEVELFGLDARGQAPLLSVMMVVQRVVMTDRRPAYLIGGSFTDPDPEARAGIQRMIDRLGGEGVSHA